jgi:hypothetical protein
MKKILYKRHFQVCAALLAADCLVFTLIDPQQANAAWLGIGFGLFGATLLAISHSAAEAFHSYGDKTHAISKRVFRYTALLIMAMVGLQSIGQLTLKDVMALLPFAAILYFYYGYGKKLAPADP